MNATAPTQTNDPAALAATIDALLQQRMQAMTQPQAQQPAMPATPPGFFQPFAQQQPQPQQPTGFPGFAPMAAAGSMAPPMPTEIHCRVSIPLPDGREVGGYIAFPIPASHASPAGLQALAAAIVATWPVAAYPPRQNGGGGFQGGGGGYGQQNGYQGGGGGGGYGQNGAGFRRYPNSGGSNFGRRW